MSDQHSRSILEKTIFFFKIMYKVLQSRGPMFAICKRNVKIKIFNQNIEEHELRSFVMGGEKAVESLPKNCA